MVNCCDQAHMRLGGPIFEDWDCASWHLPYAVFDGLERFSCRFGGTTRRDRFDFRQAGT
jgi:hypothetical protein